ncbi:hypothetical protein [Microbacterium sp. R86528]|uniref:hypothetical protein n=1 Tax=Microbacterium sp. R86528 TaxID=3093864 RepID=UPI0037CA9320
MIWRRYRSTLGLAIATSAAIGILCGLAVYLGGNADYRAQSGWGGFAYWIVLGAVCGVGTGFMAILVAVLAVASRDRDLARASSSRINIGVAGATIGSALPWGAFGVATAMTGGAGYSYIFIGVAVVAAVFTAVLARIMLGRVERRHDTYP